MLTLFIFCVSFYTTAQNIVLKNPAAQAIEQAKELMLQEKYEEAVAQLNASIAQDQNNEMAYYYLGSAYQALDKHSEAALNFTKAKMLMEATIKSRPFSSAETKEFHILQYRLAYAAEQALLLKSPNTMKEPMRLSNLINSDFGDYFPMLDPTGTKLYFTSTRPEPTGARSFLKNKTTKKENPAPSIKEGDEDIYYVEKVNGVWGNPVKMPEPLNTDNNDGAACFSADGRLMVFGACGRSDALDKSCDLYMATYEDWHWSLPKNMGNIVNSNEWDAQTTLSYDGSKIIFASGRCGGYGETDLYLVEKNIFGEWGIPVNLGGMVNTPFNEYAPFFSQDGKTLYFSSDGHPGFGGLDIFKSVLENGKWSTPLNLGKPLNTSADDKYFTIGGSGETGYFASDRDGKGLDIYEIEIPEEMRPQPTIVVIGTVTDAKTNATISAYIMIEDMNSNEMIAVNKSSADGKYIIVLPAGKTYSVSANKEGFFFYSQLFDVPLKTEYKEIKKDLQLKPIEKGTKVVFNNIFFESGKAVLTPQSNLELEKIFDLLKANPTMVVEVGGHTDNVGDEDFNRKLSHDRAKAVREYLVNRGVNPDHIQAKGYGELNPVATNDTEDGRKANRRTEFVILDF